MGKGKREGFPRTGPCVIKYVKQETWYVWGNYQWLEFKLGGREGGTWKYKMKIHNENTKPWISVFSSMGFCPVGEGKPQKDFKQTWEFKMRKVSFILKKTIIQ